MSKNIKYYDAFGNQTGFGISAEFRVTLIDCGQFPPTIFSYTYVQVYDFWFNGVAAPQVRIYGPGLNPVARYHVYYRLDLSANRGNNDDFFEYYAIDAAQYPPYEHDFHDDEVYKTYLPVGYEWMNRDGSPYFQGYVSRPWLYSDYTSPPPNQNAYWTFVHIPSEQEEGPPSYNTTAGEFINFPKAWDNNQPIHIAQNLVNWFVSTVQASGTPSYCKPTNHCGVGICFTPFNY